MKNITLYLMPILVLILFLLIISCSLPTKNNQESVIKRKYDFCLSNHVGSEWYECDSVIRISNNRFQLKNNEDSAYYIDITVPNNAVVRIYTNE